MEVNKGGAPLNNTNGSHDKPWQKALLVELKNYNPDSDDNKELPVSKAGPNGKVEEYFVLRRLVRKAIDKGLTGDMSALNHIADRTDGKPMQSIEAKVTEIPHEQWIDDLDE